MFCLKDMLKFTYFSQELSTEKISGSVLEQTRIVNSSQILLVWINKSMQVALTVGKYFSISKMHHNQLSSILLHSKIDLNQLLVMGALIIIRSWLWRPISTKD